MTEDAVAPARRKVPTTEHDTAADQGPRCWRCGRKLAIFVTRPWVIVCGRCKARNQAATVH